MFLNGLIDIFLDPFKREKSNKNNIDKTDFDRESTLPIYHMLLVHKSEIIIAYIYIYTHISSS